MTAAEPSGRVCLVFGGGSELPVDGARPMANGQAIATRLAEEGAAVAVTDVSLERAQSTVSGFGGGGLALAADADDPAQCRDVVDQVVARLGRLDVVVCNVGIHGRQPIRSQTVEDWDRTFSVNVRSHYLVAQAALSHMLARRSGCFIFVSSTSALRSSGTSLAYEASKAAQLAVSRHIAVRYCDRGIRSNSLVLGAIDTPLAGRLYGGEPSDNEARDRMCLMQRQGRSAEVAAAAAYLASADAAYVTGTELLVDGGMVAASYAFRPRRPAGLGT